MDCDTYSMGSLFSRLWKHCSKEAKPRENFFSDIVAELFKTHPEFLFKWLDALEVDLIRGTDPEIVYQEWRFDPLTGISERSVRSGNSVSANVVRRCVSFGEQAK
jgi:hypothetical protein